MVDTNCISQTERGAAAVPPPAATIPAVREGCGTTAIAALQNDWRSLCANAGNDEPFYRPEWIEAYVQAFAPEAKLIVAAARCGGRLSGILPLISGRTMFCGLPARILSSPTNPHSPRFDLLRARGDSGDAAVDAIWEALKTLQGWDVIELREVPEDGAAMRLLDLAARDGYLTGRWQSKQTPIVLTAASTAEPWLEHGSASFRKNLRRVERKLAALGEVRARSIDTPDLSWMEAFYALERSGWKGASGSAIACHPGTRYFYDRIARSAGQFGDFLMHALECDGRLVGASYGIRYRDRLYTPKLGIDEHFKACSPGHLTVQAILRDCVARGITVCDFVGPCLEWEAHWASFTRPHDWIWIFRNSIVGRCLHAAKFTARPALRRVHGYLRSLAGTPGEAATVLR
jgi:CelD/BcsL family acetyltransferase involved in cellulose biosynthesis